MKSVFVIATATIFLTGALAHADYQCQSVPQGSTLSVKVQQYPNRVGTDTEILLQTAFGSGRPAQLFLPPLYWYSPNASVAFIVLEN